MLKLLILNMEVKFEDVIRSAAPSLEVVLVEAEIDNPRTSDALWNRFEETAALIREKYKMEEIRHRPAIAGTRDAYKALGKEPNRYRPSAEALCRRAVKGMELYRTLTVIDLINLVSMLTGHSIGGFDADKIAGDTITLGSGRHGEPYEAIGRGELNIENLPVFRDSVGGIGTPTSDNDRTKLSPETHRLLMTVNIYRTSDGYDTDDVEKLIRDLLAEFASLRSIKFKRYKAE